MQGELSRGVMAEIPPPSPAVVFRCSGCRKNLRAGAELAGKKIQCPQCGQVMRAPEINPSAPPPAPFWGIPIPPPWLVLGLVLLATFLLKLRNLDHTGLTHWDEVFHAVVAQNV